MLEVARVKALRLGMLLEVAGRRWVAMGRICPTRISLTAVEAGQHTRRVHLPRLLFLHLICPQRGITVHT